MDEINAIALTAGMPPIQVIKYFWTNLVLIPRRLKGTQVIFKDSARAAQ